MPRLMLGAAAALLAVIFAVLPVERQTVEYSWVPESDGEAVPMLLVERTPDVLSLWFPCSLVAEGDRTLFASSRVPGDVPALSLRVEQAAVVAELPTGGDDAEGGGSRVELEVPHGSDCDVLMGFDRASESLAISAGGNRTEATVGQDAFEVTGLHWSADTANVRAEIRTTPFAMARNSTPQKLTLLGILALGIAAVVASVRGGRQWRPEPRSWRLAASEWATAVLAIGVALVDLPRVDDGRILARARSVAGFDLHANVPVLVENTIVPQRWLYEWLLGTTVGWSNAIPVIRGLSVLAMVGAWMMIRRRLLPRMGAVADSSRWFVVTVWGVHATFVVAWTATLRPEPFLVFLTTAVLATVASWPVRPRAWPYALVVLFVGLAVATHVAGLVTAFAALPVLAWLIRDLRSDPVPALTGCLWGGALSIGAMFLGSNVAQHYRAARDFQDGGVHELGPLDSLLYLDGIQASTAPMMLATGLGLIGAVVAVGAMLRRLLDRRLGRVDAVVVGAALAPLGLLFTPSKWLWHLAVLAPTATIGWMLLARRLRGRHAPTAAPAAVVGGALGLVLSWALLPAWNARVLTGWWRPTALRHVAPDAWADRVPSLVGGDLRWWVWVLLFVVVAVSVREVARRVSTSLGADGAGVAVALIASMATVSIVQLAPPVADAVVSGSEWTFVRQSTVGTVRSDVACGVPAATPMPSDGAGGPGFLDVDAGRVAGHSLVYLFAPCHGSVVQRDGIWQVPPLLMGDLSHAQRRFLVEYDARRLTCNSFPRTRSEDRLCFSYLQAEGEALEPAAVRWSTDAPAPPP